MDAAETGAVALAGVVVGAVLGALLPHLLARSGERRQARRQLAQLLSELMAIYVETRARSETNEPPGPSNWMQQGLH
jgi:uncharacterized membrane protein YccC